MRSVLKVLFGFLSTVLFFILASNLTESLSIFLHWLDLESLLRLMAILMGLTGSAICFLFCVFYGYKDDATDVWAKEKKDRGWAAYSAFVGASFALGLAFLVADLSYETTFFDIFMTVVCIAVAVIGYAVGAFAIADLEKYESPISDEDLKKLFSELTDDYLEVNLDRVTSRAFDGFSTQVTIEDDHKPSEIVLDFDPDETWYTSDGRVVKLFTYEQWAIVYDTTNKKVVSVYESKVKAAGGE